MVGPLLSTLLLVSLVAGYGYIVLAEPGRSGRAAHFAVAPPSSAIPTSGSPTSASVNPPVPPPAATSSPPVRLTIAAIGVDTSLQSLGLLSDGSLQPPTRWDVAGWYARGVLPGNVGPAVIAGHVDSTSGPAVFFRLRELRVGDQLVVRRQDGTRASFEVDDVHAYSKAQFPTSAVYGPAAEPVLRLITCTGDFDPNAGSYLQNLVVSAHLV
ncbi:MAG: class F sortase [Jatrophihabitantaceae bacterium]